MEKEKVINVVSDVQNKPNKDLFEVSDLLIEEHKNTKDLILDLINHLDAIEEYFDKVQKEISKRTRSI